MFSQENFDIAKENVGGLALLLLQQRQDLCTMEPEMLVQTYMNYIDTMQCAFQNVTNDNDTTSWHDKHHM